jgi:hypothetical protein
LRFENVEAIYREWLYLDHDPDILRILYSIFLANRYDGLPVWAMLIGKSGCGKSELLNSLEEVSESYLVSKLTPNALASGFREGEHSLLNHLDKKILIIKDMSTLTEMPADARGSIFADLRDSYDGRFVKKTGSGNVEWRGKFGVIGGATPAIEKIKGYDAALGERFLNLKFRSDEEDEYKIQVKSINNNTRRSVMTKALKDVAIKFFKQFRSNKELEIPETVIKAILTSARSVVKARSSVSRDRFTRDVDEMVTTSEVPTRVTAQLLLVARAALDIGSDEETTIRLVQRLCLDSIPSVRIQILRHLLQGAERAKDLRPLVRMSRPVIERSLEDLWFLHLVSRDKGGNYEVIDGSMEDILINTGTAKPKEDDDGDPL